MLTGQRLPVDWQGFVATRTASGAWWRLDRLVFWRRRAAFFATPR